MQTTGLENGRDSVCVGLKRDPGAVREEDDVSKNARRDDDAEEASFLVVLMTI
jgi:hypothetical protein